MFPFFIIASLKVSFVRAGVLLTWRVVGHQEILDEWPIGSVPSKWQIISRC